MDDRLFEVFAGVGTSAAASSTLIHAIVGHAAGIGKLCEESLKGNLRAEQRVNERPKGHTAYLSASRNRQSTFLMDWGNLEAIVPKQKHPCMWMCGGLSGATRCRSEQAHSPLHCVSHMCWVLVWGQSFLACAYGSAEGVRENCGMQAQTDEQARPLIKPPH